MNKGNLTLRSLKIKNLGFLHKFLHADVNLGNLRVVDLGDNNLGKENCDEICHLLLHDGQSLEKLILSNNRIGSSGLS
jgi:Ran GTPase-activating protein (RanGAP) involved in mRNA processing and transport